MNTYSISITCIPSDRLITDEYGEQFFECMSEEELERIQKENNKDSLKTYLFNTLSSMDSTISTIIADIERATPSSIKIIFTIKDSSKGSILNISNEELSTTETIVLGNITIGIGIASIVIIPKLIASAILVFIADLIISYITAWLLTEVYLSLRNKSIELWQDLKKTSNQAIQNIMSVIETDERSLQERKEEITERAANKILNSTHQSKMTQKEYEECIAYLCEHCCDKQDSANKKYSQQLSPFYSFLPPNTINSHRVGEIHFDIQALDEYTRVPIPNAKLQLQNVNLEIESLTDSKGLHFKDSAVLESNFDSALRVM